MNLNVNFSVLNDAIKKMGADPITFSTHTRFEHTKLDEILSTSAGQKIDIDDINLNLDGAGGLLEYQGRQVLLFLPKQFNDISLVKRDYSKGNKFHIADCSTLKQQQERGTFRNYSANNNLFNKFKVHGSDSNNNRDEFDTKLNVCQNCLKKLNYKNFNHETWEQKKSIVEHFQIDEFFETYSTLFEYTPIVETESTDIEYTTDWQDVSKAYRESKNYICETCHISLKDDRGLLHTHHINGIKDDNDLNNLKAVCIDCHRKEPRHKHILMTYSELQKIHILRREQDKNTNLEGWEDVFKFSDLSIYGYLNILKSNGRSIPEVGYIVEVKKKKIALDLVWITPTKKSALVTEYFHEYLNLEGWNILTIGDAMYNDIQNIQQENNDMQITNRNALEFKAMIDYTATIETKLEGMGAKGRGLHGKITKVQRRLSEDTIFKLRRIATIRNKRMHRKDFNNYIFEDFENDCKTVIEYLETIN